MLIKKLSKGNFEILKVIVEKFPHTVNQPTSFGLTPLHYASESSNFDAIKFLIDNGAEVNSKSKLGQTPLHIAALYNRHENVRVLISLGAGVSVCSHDGRFTALHVACNSRNYECAALLVKRSADLNLQVIFEKKYARFWLCDFQDLGQG